MTEMKFMRHWTGCSLCDHRRNGDVLEQLKAEPVKKKLTQYKQEKLNCVSRMEDITDPEQLLDYEPIRKRTVTYFKETTGRIQSWDRNRSFIGL